MRGRRLNGDVGMRHVITFVYSSLLHNRRCCDIWYGCTRGSRRRAVSVDRWPIERRLSNHGLQWHGNNVFIFAKHHSRCSVTAALSPTDACMPFTLHRRQFTIRPAFTMRIKCARPNAEQMRRAARRAHLYSRTAVCGGFTMRKSAKLSLFVDNFKLSMLCTRKFCHDFS